MACELFSCGMWDLVPPPGIEPRPPALGVLATGTPGDAPWDFILPFLMAGPFASLLHSHPSLDLHNRHFSSIGMCVLNFSSVWFFVTPQTVARQAPLSMGFSRQEYWGSLPFPPPGDLPNPEIKPTSPASCALASGFFTTELGHYLTATIFFIFLWIVKISAVIL